MGRVRNFTDSSGMRIYLASVSLNEPRVTGRMVCVFVCIQKKVQFPTLRIQKFFDLFGIVRIYGKSFRGFGISENVSEVSKRAVRINPKDFQKNDLMDDIQVFV